MPELYFIFNNISSIDMPIMINELPSITKPTRDMNKIVIPGRDGYLTEDLETHQGTIKSCECTILDIAEVDQVLSWLDGSGEVIFSNQPDRKYQACIINQIPFTRFMRNKWYKFIIIFDCQPFAKMLENPLITFTTAGTIYNGGTHKSKPAITVFGNGTIDLIINDSAIHLTNVVDYVTIDSDLLDCYKDAVLKNSDMSGDFPELAVGENVISWTGTVTKIDISPNWRWM